MTNKQTVVAALEHNATHPVPYQIDLTVPAFAKMAEFYGNDSFHRDRLNNCFVGTIPALPATEIEPEIFKDAFGSIWNKTIDKDIGIVQNVVVTPESLADYQFPDVESTQVYRFTRDRVAQHPDKFVIYYLGFSLYERAWVLAGMETVLMGMAADPDFVHTLLDRILEFNLVQIANACEAGVDGIWIGDDWGQQTGLIMGPAHWREFIKPRIKVMYETVKAHGKKVIIHCCGKVDEILPELIELGVDLFNPFQPEVMDVYKIKEQFGNEIGFWGGISTQQLLPFGTPEQVREEVRRLLDKIGRDGGYIAAPAHAIPGDAKPENIDAMIEVLNGQ